MVQLVEKRPALKLPAGLYTMTAAQIPAYARLENSQRESGWKLQKGLWTPGRPEQKDYANMEFANSAIEVDASERSTLALSIVGQVATTEVQNDFFVVQVTDEQGATHLVGKFSGQLKGDGNVPATDTENDLYFNLNAFAGKKIRIDLLFVSDFVRTEGLGVGVEKLIFH